MNKLLLIIFAVFLLPLISAEDCYVYDDFSLTGLNLSKWSENPNNSLSLEFLDKHFIDNGVYHAEQLTAREGAVTLKFNRKFSSGDIINYELNYLGGEGNRGHLIELDNAGWSAFFVLGVWNADGIPAGNELGKFYIQLEFIRDNLIITVEKPNGEEITFEKAIEDKKYEVGLVTRTGHNGLISLDYDNVRICEGLSLSSEQFTSEDEIKPSQTEDIFEQAAPESESKLNNSETKNLAENKSIKGEIKPITNNLPKQVQNRDSHGSLIFIVILLSFVLSIYYAKKHYEKKKEQMIEEERAKRIREEEKQKEEKLKKENKRLEEEIIGNEEMLRHDARLANIALRADQEELIRRRNKAKAEIKSERLRREEYEKIKKGLQEQQLKLQELTKLKFEKSQRAKGLELFEGKWVKKEEIPKLKEIKIGLQNNFADYSPYEFEKFIEQLFTAIGYKTIVTRKSRDYGVDVIAEKGSDKIAIQVKRYRTGSPVGNREVQMLLGAMQKKDVRANHSLIITTSHFTVQAREQADECAIELWDKNELHKMVKKYLMNLD